MPLFFHDGHDVFAHQKHCFQVDIDLRIPVVFRELDRTAQCWPSHIVHKDIDRAVLRKASRDEFFDLVTLRHITGVRRDVAVKGTDEIERFVHGMQIFVDCEDFRTFLSEANRHGSAIAPARSDASCTRD